MKKSLFLAGATLFALTVSASAQQRGFNNGFNNNGFNNQGNQNGFNNQNRGGQNGGALPLPEGVKRVVSIDALGVLLAEVDVEGKTDYAPITVRHVYSGGIARLFGGQSVPTEQFVSPGAQGGQNGGQNRGNNRGNNRFSGAGGGLNGGGIGGGIGGNNFGGGIGGNTGFGGNAGFGGNQGFGGNFGSFLMRPTAGGRN